MKLIEKLSKVSPERLFVMLLHAIGMLFLVIAGIAWAIPNDNTTAWACGMLAVIFMSLGIFIIIIDSFIEAIADKVVKKLKEKDDLTNKEK